MVAGVDDDGVVHQAFGFEVGEDAGEIIVHPFDAAQVFFEIDVVGFALGGGVVHGGIDFKILVVAAAVVAAADGGGDDVVEFAVGAAGRDGAFAAFPQAEGFGNGDVGEVVFVTRGVFEIIVRGLVVQF